FKNNSVVETELRYDIEAKIINLGDIIEALRKDIIDVITHYLAITGIPDREKQRLIRRITYDDKTIKIEFNEYTIFDLNKVVQGFNQIIKPLTVNNAKIYPIGNDTRKFVIDSDCFRAEIEYQRVGKQGYTTGLIFKVNEVKFKKCKKLQEYISTKILQAIGLGLINPKIEYDNNLSEISIQSSEVRLKLRKIKPGVYAFEDVSFNQQFINKISEFAPKDIILLNNFLTSYANQEIEFKLGRKIVRTPRWVYELLKRIIYTYGTCFDCFSRFDYHPVYGKIVMATRGYGPYIMFYNPISGKLEVWWYNYPDLKQEFDDGIDIEKRGDWWCIKFKELPTWNGGGAFCAKLVGAYILFYTEDPGLPHNCVCNKYNYCDCYYIGREWYLVYDYPKFIEGKENEIMDNMRNIVKRFCNRDIYPSINQYYWITNIGNSRYIVREIHHRNNWNEKLVKYDRNCPASMPLLALFENETSRLVNIDELIANIKQEKVTLLPEIKKKEFFVRFDWSPLVHFFDSIKLRVNENIKLFDQIIGKFTFKDNKIKFVPTQSLWIRFESLGERLNSGYLIDYLPDEYRSRFGELGKVRSRVYDQLRRPSYVLGNGLVYNCTIDKDGSRCALKNTRISDLTSWLTRALRRSDRAIYDFVSDSINKLNQLLSNIRLVTHIKDSENKVNIEYKFVKDSNDYDFVKIIASIDKEGRLDLESAKIDTNYYNAFRYSTGLNKYGRSIVLRFRPKPRGSILLSKGKRQIVLTQFDKDSVIIPKQKPFDTQYDELYREWLGFVYS
ncbi:MAG: hypothetical protein DSY42_09655, partial [Aquifex sp.]